MYYKTDVLSGQYHALYEQHGEVKGERGNMFHCFFQESHSGGVDRNPSMSVDNATGMFNCFACGAKGNYITYLRDKHGKKLYQAHPELKRK